MMKLTTARLVLGALLVVGLAIGLTACESSGSSSSTVYVGVHGGYGYGPGWGGWGWGGYYPMPPVMGPPIAVPYY